MYFWVHNKQKQQNSFQDKQLLSLTNTTVRPRSAHGPFKVRSWPLCLFFIIIEMRLYVSERCHESDCYCSHHYSNTVKTL